MLLRFSIRVAERPSVCERAVYSVNYTCLSRASNFACVLLSLLVLRVGSRM